MLLLPASKCAPAQLQLLADGLPPVPALQPTLLVRQAAQVVREHAAAYRNRSSARRDRQPGDGRLEHRATDVQDRVQPGGRHVHRHRELADQVRRHPFRWCRTASPGVTRSGQANARSTTRSSAMHCQPTSFNRSPVRSSLTQGYGRLGTRPSIRMWPVRSDPPGRPRSRHESLRWRRLIRCRDRLGGQ